MISTVLFFFGLVSMLLGLFMFLLKFPSGKPTSLMPVLTGFLIVMLSLTMGFFGC